MSWVTTYGKQLAEPKSFASDAERKEFIKNERKLRTVDTKVTAGRHKPSLQCKDVKRRKEPPIKKGVR